MRTWFAAAAIAVADADDTYVAGTAAALCLQNNPATTVVVIGSF